MVLGVVNTQGELAVVTTTWLRAPSTLGHRGDGAAPGFLLCPQVLVTAGQPSPGLQALARFALSESPTEGLHVMGRQGWGAPGNLEVCCVVC